ncbi:hypothetical protein [Thioalkalivibrio thiocyanodenitrificans]|uniref:hypothetical protein n=1 Tax=Thioalkalivibrio thiocyanodenitrificans TaxID=243063 RepID=UPI0003A1D434|nr:hypothetical protein [Thioalkalivibrio thiocyanodenitrificans]
MMEVMDSPGAHSIRIPWPLIRLAALVVVVLVFGFAGVWTGIRTAGGLLVVFAIVQLARRFAGDATRCEISGQLPVWPALLLAAVQASVGVVMLVRPAAILGLLGVEGL